MTNTFVRGLKRLFSSDFRLKNKAKKINKIKIAENKVSVKKTKKVVAKKKAIKKTVSKKKVITKKKPLSKKKVIRKKKK